MSEFGAERVSWRGVGNFILKSCPIFMIFSDNAHYTIY